MIVCWLHKQNSNASADKNFGLPLEFIASRASEKGAPSAVPIIITKSIDFLRKKGQCSSFKFGSRSDLTSTSEATKLEGIFRISGDSRGINMLKEKFDTTGTILRREAAEHLLTTANRWRDLHDPRRHRSARSLWAVETLLPWATSAALNVFALPSLDPIAR